MTQNYEHYLYRSINSTPSQSGISGNEGAYEGPGIGDIKTGAVSAIISAGNVIIGILNQAIIHGFPILQGFILMVMAVLFPIFLVIGGFKIETTVNFVFMFITVYLWTGVWHIARWFDNVLISSMYKSTSVIEGVFTIEKALADTIAAFSYVISIYVFSKMMLVAGSTTSARVGELADSAVLTKGTSQGLSSVGSVAGKFKK